jgi:hemerythrin superfamily protein
VGRDDRELERHAMPTKDIIDLIREDHEEVKGLLSKVDNATSGEARKEAFDELVRRLVAHEVAEQVILHPLTRKGPNGDAVADARLKEEADAEERLSDLESMGVEDEDFAARFETLRRRVLEHAESEETTEHPRVREAIDPDHLVKLAPVFEVAKKAAPTHPHPDGPQSPAGHAVTGPLVAIADRVRDAARGALDKVS